MDNRDLASAILATLALAWCLWRKDTRSALMGLLRAALQPKVIVPLAAQLALVLLLVLVAARLGIWTAELAAPTVIWFGAVGLVLLVNLERSWKSPRFFRSALQRVLGAGALIGLFVNLFSLSLVGELLLQPTIALLSLVAVVAHRDVAHRSVERLAEVFLIAIGAGLLTFSGVQLVRHWGTLDLRLLTLEFLLPVWLTIGVLPFIYVMAYYAAYEDAFLRINFAVPERHERVRAKVAALLTIRLHLRDASALTFYWARRAGEAGSVSAARRVLRDFRRSIREASQEQELAELRLVTNTGMSGTDGEGRQLDQREFQETKRALQWLATCQMGWYRNRGGRYRADMLDIVGDLKTQDLPAQHGIELHLAPDGQAWWAGRRTVTGWYFAIGAAGPPPDQWECDGAEPPGGFPGEHPDWGDGPFSFGACANW